MVEGTCTSWGSCRRGSRVRLGARCGAAPQGAPCLVEEERWEEVEGKCRGSTCLDRELGVVSRRHPVCVARQASLAQQASVNQAPQEAEAHDLMENKMLATKNMTTKQQNDHAERLTSTVPRRNSLNTTNTINETVPDPIQGPTRATNEPTHDPAPALAGGGGGVSLLPSCRGKPDLAAQYRLLTLCRDCYNLFREADVFTLCTDGCFTSPFLLTCARALLVQVDTVQEAVTSVG